jgi:hypothetical protein
MTCKECGQVVRLTRTIMKCVIENTELSSLEGTRDQFNGRTGVIKLATRRVGPIRRTWD